MATIKTMIHMLTEEDVVSSLTATGVSAQFAVPNVSVVQALNTSLTNLISSVSSDLSTKISSDITALTANYQIGNNQIVSSITQTDGKVYVGTRPFEVADISSVAVVSSDFEGTYFGHRIKFGYSSGKITLGFGELTPLSIDCTDFIRDRMLSNVVPGTDEYGPYLVFWWNIEDSEHNISTRINLKSILSGFYTGAGNIIKINDQLQISADEDAIKTLVEYEKLNNFYKFLSGDGGNPGAIPVMSSEISTIQQEFLRNLKYLGNITNPDDVNQNKLSTLLGGFDSGVGTDWIWNGTFLPVNFPDNVVSAQTTDGVLLGDGDILIIRKSSPVIKFKIDQLVVPDDVCIIKAGVSRYDFSDLVDSYDKNKKFNLTISSNYTGIVSSNVGPAVKRHGDVLVISNEISTDSEGTGKYNITGYTWSSELSNWVAMDGNYYANNIYLNDNLTCAGSYTNVGNIKLSSQNQVLNVKGKNLYDFLTAVFDTTVQPTHRSYPAIGEVKLTNSPLNVEVGTIITPNVKVSFNQGTYNYSWMSNPVENDGTAPSAYYVCNKDNTSQCVSSYITSASYTGSLPQISVEDNTNYSISTRVEYTEGFVAKDNKGNDSDPVLRHSGGTLTATAASTNRITGYRKSFYYTGNKLDSWGDEPLTGFHLSNFSSDYIRSGKASPAAADLNANITVSAGTMLIWYAVPGKKDLIEVIDEKGQGLDVKANFIQINQKVHRLFNVPVYGAGNRLSTYYTVFYNLSESSDGFTETILHFKTKNFTN